MITGVQDVYYNVHDLKRALKFYTETLGMKLVHSDGKWWASLDLDGVPIGLHWSEKPVPLGPRDNHGAHAGATLTLRSTDVKADRKVLEAAGAKVLGELDEAWGHLLVFEDLDGNILKLMKPKPH